MIIQTIEKSRILFDPIRWLLAAEDNRDHYAGETELALGLAEPVPVCGARGWPASEIDPDEFEAVYGWFLS